MIPAPHPTIVGFQDFTENQAFWPAGGETTDFFFGLGEVSEVRPDWAGDSEVRPEFFFLAGGGH